jgi:hypothetical protein
MAVGKMITVGTPGLGVRQPDGSTLAWISIRLFRGSDVDWTWIGHGLDAMRVADARSGRPPAGWVHISVDFHPAFLWIGRGLDAIRVAGAPTRRADSNKF